MNCQADPGSPSASPVQRWLKTMVVLAAVAAMLSGVVAVVTEAPAHARARVSVGNGQGAAAVDPKYATKLSLSGSGFQSIKNGYGGIYVFFGTVRGAWKPSQGGQTGRNMLYVPDSETKNNQGYQKFVTFPGSDTAGAANGGTLRRNGKWSTTINVPGAVFDSRDRSNRVRRVDCRKVQCGIITIGAHGVKNARNETFTPVSVRSLTAAQRGTTSTRQRTVGGDQAGVGGPGGIAGGDAADKADKKKKKKKGKAGIESPTLRIDRDTAVAGRILSFSATGLEPGEQVTATLDDGAAAVGPLSAGPDGQLAGTLKLPADISIGTHQLRLSGGLSGPTISFPVSAQPNSQPERSGFVAWLPRVAAALALLLLLGAITLAVSRMRSATRKGERRETAVA